jgi:hypothetical protein
LVNTVWGEVLYFGEIVFVVVKNSPCVDVGVGFLSSIINEVVGYLVNGDVPNSVLRDGINRRVSDGVSKIMGIVHVRGHRWPSTIESILSRIAHALFKEATLGVRHGRFIASTAEFCAYVDEVRAVICGSPDLLIHDLRGKSAYLVELRLAPTSTQRRSLRWQPSS